MSKFREAKSEDLKSIVDIYNTCIEEGGYTADTSIYTLEDKRDWFQEVHSANCGIYILEEEERVMGYFYFSPWRKGRRSLASVRELSFYLDKPYRGKGYGDLIVEQGLKMAKLKGFNFLMAIILDDNLRSQKLLEKWGFKLVGELAGIVELGENRVGQFIFLKRI